MGICRPRHSCSLRPFASPQSVRLTRIWNCLLSQPWGSHQLPCTRSLRSASAGAWDVPASHLLGKVVPHGHPASCLCRENFLVLDVFFEALTSEAMEQRAAYGLSALLGETWPRFHGCGSAGPSPSDPASVIPRRPRGTDGPVHRGQHPHTAGDPGLHL